MMHIAKFIWDEDEAHTLLLFYYAGHGTPKAFRDGSNSLALTGFVYLLLPYDACC